MDNLYNSAKFFAKLTIIHRKFSNCKEQFKVHGKVKAVVLTDDPVCPDLCAVSIYDNKPVHFLTMCNTAIKWITKKRRVYNKEK